MNWKQLKRFLVENKIQFREPKYSVEEMTKGYNEEEQKALKCYSSFFESYSLDFEVFNKSNYSIFCFAHFHFDKFSKKKTYDLELWLTGKQLKLTKLALFVKYIKKYIHSNLTMEQVIQEVQEFDSKWERLAKITNQIEKLQQEKNELENYLKSRKVEEVNDNAI